MYGQVASCLCKKIKMKILLLGSIRKRIYNCTTHRQTIIAVDSYENAPAMQVAHGFEVINMLDGEALDRIVAKHKPDFIVPEIEAIRTERFTITKTRYYCSSFCESGKFHNEPKSHP
jgi:formate-dependent phosphoribosylglycinamide formyltransferase (GAR transformylase)